MSTKIYNAYQYRGSLSSLLRFLKQSREVEQQKFVESVCREWVPEDFDFVLFMDELRKAIGGGEHFVRVAGRLLSNPAASAVVYTARVKYRDTLLVQFFGVERAVLEALPPARFRDFHYQNQTDFSHSRREQDKRERVWNSVLGNDGIPSHAGLTFTFFDEADVVSLAIRVFERLHGHQMRSEESTTCKACIHRREIAANKREGGV